jgi:ubiquinone/menaquinone biosynthesis C-methylase UbiE
MREDIVVTKKSALTTLFLQALFVAFAAAPAAAQPGSAWRDRVEQPQKVMEATGVKPGMVVGEVGAGQGYFTFWLSKGVGETGKVYANDISRRALDELERRRDAEKATNIETILGTVEDPLFPAGTLDMVFIVNAFHDLARPVELLANLRPALKPDATVVIMDRDPAKIADPSRHFLTREQVEEIVGRSVFKLVRTETFLRQHNLYVLKARKPAVSGTASGVGGDVSRPARGPAKSGP